jgi:glycosyltransferase involved in cell wall biosynthesis
MVRVYNEAEFLAPAVRSIASFVDEVVLIDNASSDATPEVIATLARELPGVRSVSYPHRLARLGRENLDSIRAGHPSHLRLSGYSNWAMRQCRFPFILRWDGDMVAGVGFADAWEEWRSGGYLSMRFTGLNAHSDRVHVLAARHREPAVIGRPLAGDVVPDWTSTMTQTGAETRLHPRFLARYDDGYWWCERQQSPLSFGPFARRFQLEPPAPLFLHLKYWKRSPHNNHSPDFEAMIQGNIAVGPPLPDEWRRVLDEYGLT